VQGAHGGGYLVKPLKTLQYAAGVTNWLQVGNKFGYRLPGRTKPGGAILDLWIGRDGAQRNTAREGMPAGLGVPIVNAGGRT